MAGPTAGRPLDLTSFDPDRLYRRVGVDPRTGCWLWFGSKNTSGYGVVGIGDARNGYTHRVAYTLFVGPIPAGLTIDHLCRNRACCNPEHLEAVEQGDNVRRSPRANRTTCRKGHPLVLTERTGRGNRQVWRSCPTCQRQANALRSDAARILGLTQRQYLRQYGGAVSTARAIVASAASGAA